MAESPDNRPAIGMPSDPNLVEAGRHPAGGEPGEADVRAALDRALAADVFKGSERLRRFLRHSVEETLQGRGKRLKEYVIGAEVFDRPDTFDPRADPVVRVEARRLRAKLAEYYASDGHADPIRLDLPKGSYAAVFRRAIGRPPDGGISAGTLPSAGGGLAATGSPAGHAGEGRASTGDAPLPPWGGGVPAGTEGAGSVSAVVAAGHHAGRRWLVVLAMSALAVFVVAGVFAVVRLWSRPPAAPTVAVLPFANASRDPDNQYLCFGLVEDLTTTLAQIPGLRVVARTSAMQFEGAHDVREIGRRLHTDFVVEGSVRREGEQLRITAQLVDARDGSHLWADAYDRDVRNLLATEAEIARAIAVALRTRIAPAVAAAPAAAIDPDLYGLYLKGQYFVGVVDRQAPGKGLSYLQQVIAQAPRFAPAHARCWPGSRSSTSGTGTRPSADSGVR